MAKQPEKGKSRQRLKRLKGTLLSGLFLFVVFISTYGGFRLANSSWFDLQFVEVQGQDRLDQESILEATGLFAGQNLLHIRTNEVAEKVETLAYVKDARVRRRFPNRVDVSIIERAPVAMVMIENERWLIDGEGALLENIGKIETEQTQWPVIIAGPFVEAPKLGALTKDEGLLAALTFLRQVDPYFMENILRIEAESVAEMKLIHRDGLKVFIGPPENLPQKLQFYEEILIKNAVTCNARTLEYVDLRYDTQPIIKRKEGVQENQRQ